MWRVDLLFMLALISGWCFFFYQELYYFILFYRFRNSVRCFETPSDIQKCFNYLLPVIWSYCIMLIVANNVYHRNIFKACMHKYSPKAGGGLFFWRSLPDHG